MDAAASTDADLVSRVSHQTRVNWTSALPKIEKIWLIQNGKKVRFHCLSVIV